MADAILENNRIISLLPRFNIDFGFGELTVAEVCASSGVNTAFFLEIVNSYVNDDYVARTDFSQFPLSLVVEYLKKTHLYYLKAGLPLIEDQINSLIGSSGLSDEKKKLVLTFFNDYKKEFLDHIMKEEEQVLPYILEIEEQTGKNKPDVLFVKRLKEYSINHFAREHDRLENSLTNLAELIIKYLPPFKNRALCDKILSNLFVLKEDLIDHAAMEDKVLVPKVADLEKEILIRAKS
ncbi:hemerythrin domain-containing protein [Bacteroidota bacterium]